MKFQIVLRVQTSEGSEVSIDSKLLDCYPSQEDIQKGVELYNAISHEVKIIREKPSITWRDVFDTQKLFPHNFLSCRNTVASVGYRYMCFNDRIYSTNVSNMEHYECFVEELEI